MSSSLQPPSFDLPHRPHSPRRTNSMPSPSTTSSHSSSPSSSPFQPSTFAPPFYNRPPTPLPPSPSLTSLLRPSFTPSRPTTPDSSDSEAIPRASSSLLTLSQRTPRYAPKVPPTYEYYGFGLYVLSNFTAILYLIWAFCPAEVLGGMGVTYYPSRWWSLAIPAYLVVVVCYIYVALAAWNIGVLTPPLDSLECVVDRAANIAAVGSGDDALEAPGRGKGKESKKAHEKLGGDESDSADASEKWADWSKKVKEGDWKTLWSKGTDAVMDVPIGGVCEVLYGHGSNGEEEEWEVQWKREMEERTKRWRERAESRNPGKSLLKNDNGHNK
ncbi:PIG-P-domain-containing protein [Ascodesmis nigricans]|uniref:PIG-P-domain-containing protein n=1 Tax=Ascodesmis nigricans TaxID=341454 RepID=A0A4S2N750_9PEZI|nr:PIG-P-domain-containing protein [Ascodesmis nigricans]